MAGNSRDGRSYSFSLPPLPSSALRNDNAGDSEDKGNKDKDNVVDAEVVDPKEDKEKRA